MPECSPLERGLQVDEKFKGKCHLYLKETAVQTVVIEGIPYSKYDIVNIHKKYYTLNKSIITKKEKIFLTFFKSNTGF